MLTPALRNNQDSGRTHRRAHYCTPHPPRALQNNKGSGRSNRRAAPNPTRCHCRKQHASEPRRPPRGAARRSPIRPFARANRSQTHLSCQQPMPAASRFLGIGIASLSEHSMSLTQSTSSSLFATKEPFALRLRPVPRMYLRLRPVPALATRTCAGEARQGLYVIVTSYVMVTAQVAFRTLRHPQTILTPRHPALRATLLRNSCD